MTGNRANRNYSLYRNVAFRANSAREGVILPKLANLIDTFLFEFGNKVSRDC